METATVIYKQLIPLNLAAKNKIEEPKINSKVTGERKLWQWREKGKALKRGGPKGKKTLKC